MSSVDTTAAARRLLFAAACIAYVMFSATYGRLPNIDMDEVYYKAAGRELALAGRFAAPELADIYGVDPSPSDVWLLYPPAYPLLFGAFVKCFGFGWRQCVVFDDMIKVGLACVTWAVTDRLISKPTSWLPMLAGASMLLMARSVAGRPDELAVAFGMAGLVPIIRLDDSQLRYRDAAISGVLFGCCASTSTVAAVVLGLHALVWFLARSKSVTHFIAAGALWALSVLVVIALFLTPILIQHPQAYRQYLGIAEIIFHEDTRTHWEKIIALVQVGWRVTLPVVALLVLGVVTALHSARSGSLRPWGAVWIGPILGATFLLAFDPHLYTYFWFLGPYAVAAAIATLAGTCGPIQHRGARHALAAVLIAIVAIASHETVRHAVIFLKLPHDQSIAFNANRLRTEIPPGSVVLTHDAWWHLRQNCMVYVPQISPSHWDEVDYVVVDRLEPLSDDLEAYIRKNFEPAIDNRGKHSVELLGVPLSRNVRGFGMLVLGRRLQVGQSTTDRESDRVRPN